MSNELTRQDLEHFGGELRKILRQAAGAGDGIEAEFLDMSGGGLETRGCSPRGRRLKHPHRKTVLAMNDRWPWQGAPATAPGSLPHRVTGSPGCQE